MIRRFLHWFWETRAGHLVYNIFVGWKQCDFAHHNPDTPPDVGHYCQRMQGHFGKHRDSLGGTWR